MAYQNLSALSWSVAELLRGDYKPSEYGRIILPFIVLRRLDCVLADTKASALDEFQKRKAAGLDPDSFVKRVTGVPFYNSSPLDFKRIYDAPDDVRDNLRKYVSAFSSNVEDIFENYNFAATIDDLAKKKLLYKVFQKFATEDLHPKVVSNHELGLAFEDLIRKFSELANDTAGDHFTPREVIRLMVNLLFSQDEKGLTGKGVIRTIYDPAAGTGGMLSVAEEFLFQLNPDAQLVVAGQELNPESYAICKADMLIKGQDTSKIVLGNTLTEDGHEDSEFDYGLSNPPFGVDWKKVEDEIRSEHKNRGFHGRFGPGLPRVSDGSLLFLLHLISKMRPAEKGGGRIAIVLNGSPLFTGGAGSGESEIRRWVIENDLLEAIIALPTDMFYNTGIATYIWVLSNHKPAARKGKIQLVNAVDFYQKLKKSLGNKRRELGEGDIERIVQIYGAFDEGEHSKLFDQEDFGYSTITVERPLRLRFEITEERLNTLRATKLKEIGAAKQLADALEKTDHPAHWSSREAFLDHVKQTAKNVQAKLAAPDLKQIVAIFGQRDETADPCLDKDGNPEPDPELRDTENVPLKNDIQAYFEREVLPHVPDAWIDHEKTKIGYEIPFTRHFYKFVPPRPMEEIDAELKLVTSEIMELLQKVIE
jgi:type I restriction enzyme M protein